MRTILVIEDNAQVALRVTGPLRAAGHRVLAAGDRRNGLEQFNANHVDLVVADVSAPEMVGLEILMELSRRAPGTRMVAISDGCSWMASLSSLRLATALGALRTVEQPTAPDDLLAAVDEALHAPAPGMPDMRMFVG